MHRVLIQYWMIKTDALSEARSSEELE